MRTSTTESEARSSLSEVQAPDRLAQLKRTGLLDSATEEAFDRLTRLAQRILGVPVALISLVDSDRQFFKSQVGLQEPWASLRQTPLSHSFCQHVVNTREELIVVDARDHELVRDNLAVSELGVIAYAGVPLTTEDGHVLGAFCAIDGQRREWSERDVEVLRDLAAGIMTEIHLRQVVRETQLQADTSAMERRQTEAILQSMDQGVFGLDTTGRCTFINAAAARAFGHQVEELLGQDLRPLIDHPGSQEAARQDSESPSLHAARTGLTSHGEEVYRRQDGVCFFVDCKASPLFDGRRCLGTVVAFTDITQRKEMIRRLSVQHAVSGVLAQAAGFEEASSTLLEAIGRALEWQVGSIWDVSSENQVLRNVSIWKDKEFRSDGLIKATRSLTFARNVGLPGRVWETRRPLWSCNILADLNSPRAELATADGLRSAIFFPILSGGVVRGVMEFFSTRTYPPDEELLQTFSTVGRQIGEFIARKSAEAALKRSEARKAAIFSAALDAIISIDANGLVLEWNSAAERMFGYSRAKAVGREMGELIIPADLLERHRRGIHHYLATGEGPVLDRRIELTARRADGREFPVELAITRIEQPEAPCFLGFVRDITDRVAADLNLRDSERFARNVVDALTAEIAILDENGAILTVNRGWAEFAKDNASNEIRSTGIGVNYLEVCDRAAGHGSEDAKRVADGIRAVMRGEESLFELEYPCHGLQERRWFVVRVTPFAEDGPARFVVAHENITARKLAELEHERLAQYNQLLLDSTGEGIYGLDSHGHCTFINRAAETLLGISATEVLGQNMHALTHHTRIDGSSYPLSECPIYGPLSSGQGCKVSNEVFWRSDGTSLPVEYSSFPLSEQGTVKGAVVVFSDITERKDEEQRRTEQLRFTALAADIGTAITQSLDLKTMLQRCAGALMEHLDGAFARIWTLDRDQGVLELQASAGMYTHLDGEHSRIPLGHLKIGRIAKERRPHLTNAVIGDAQVGNQEWARREDMIAFAGYPLMIGGEVLGVMGMFARHKLSNDTLQAMATNGHSIALGIQRVRTAEELKRSTESAKEANLAKSQFLANMSHELRTPLNAVIMYSELLMEEVADAGVSQFLPDLEKIRHAGRHLLGLINNILDLSKIEAGKLDVFFEQFDIRALLNEVIATIRPIVGQQGNTLELVCESEIGVMYSDITKIRQVLLNLLSNASKFTEGGTVRLEVKRQVAGDFSWMMFRVQDSGIGMTEEQLTKLFQDFTQADASTTRKYGGTGLGLAISKRLCQALGGDIEVESGLGQGSTFTVRVPSLGVDPTSMTEQPSPAADDSSINRLGGVLVIDDDRDTREMLARFLAKEGYRTVTASSGEEGLRLARQVRPHVITLDVMMPHADGWTILSALKADADLSSIPVVMLTVIDDRKRGHILGASEYLTKPIDRVRLADVLSRYRPQRAGCRVIVVDGDVTARRALTEVLIEQGCEVVEVREGREALKHMQELAPDLVFVDHQLPDMAGVEFAIQLQRDDTSRSIPVVLLTANGLSATERAALPQSVECVLPKRSCSDEELRSALRALMCVAEKSITASDPESPVPKG